MAERIQLSRKKGWRMPSNTVKVDRTTKWGNPAIVGKDGTQPECVYLYVLMLAGYTICSAGVGDRQISRIVKRERWKERVSDLVMIGILSTQPISK